MPVQATRPHFVEGMKYPLCDDAQEVPPVPCDLRVGDLVTYTNEYGAKFANRRITGFSPTLEQGRRFVYYDNAAWWFPVDPKQLRKQTSIE